MLIILSCAGMGYDMTLKGYIYICTYARAYTGSVVSVLVPNHPSDRDAAVSVTVSILCLSFVSFDKSIVSESGCHCNNISKKYGLSCCQKYVISVFFYHKLCLSLFFSPCYSYKPMTDTIYFLLHHHPSSIIIGVL